MPVSAVKRLITAAVTTGKSIMTTVVISHGNASRYSSKLSETAYIKQLDIGDFLRCTFHPRPDWRIFYIAPRPHLMR
jgi:hypothetical protein